MPDNDSTDQTLTRPFVKTLLDYTDESFDRQVNDFLGRLHNDPDVGGEDILFDTVAVNEQLWSVAYVTYLATAEVA